MPTRGVVQPAPQVCLSRAVERKSFLARGPASRLWSAFSLPGCPNFVELPDALLGTQSASVAVNMHQRVSLALLLLAVPHTASLATPVLETVALRGAASSSLRVVEGQADTIDSGAYTVSATLHPHGDAYAP